jgi:hypothetical protein
LFWGVCLQVSLGRSKETKKKKKKKENDVVLIRGKWIKGSMGGRKNRKKKIILFSSGVNG